MQRFRTQRFLAFLFWSLVFGISYTQAPLYYSNQNQYFLHGLAEARPGDLERDWLATTKDPTPLFSGMVAFTAGHLHECFFYLYYLLILGLYFHSLVGLFTFLTAHARPVMRMAEPSAPRDGLPGRAATLCFITLFVLVHAGIVRWASAQLSGVDYPWFLQAGVAGQYLLGFGLQPSVFGVFLLASMLAFLRGHPWRAVVWACLAAILHATYLPAAALLTVAFMALLYRERGFRAAFLLGVFSLLLVSPTVIYNLLTFAPTSAADFAEAQRILAHVRIPHHAVVGRWLDGIACAQVLWIVLALFLARKSKLFLIILVPFLGSLLLTLVQMWSANDMLALLFPWRTSAFLVPVATTVILTRIIMKLAPWLERLWAARRAAYLATCGLVLAVCAVGGLAVPFFELGYRTNRDELPLLAYVAEKHKRDDVYLVPVELPPQSAARGVFSSNFTPAPRRHKAGSFIAIDLQGFRLTTRAPLYVDFKSIPYKDGEVLEWYRRVLWCQRIYADRTSTGEEIRAQLRREGITHVVAPADNDLPFACLGIPLHRDAAYRVFAVRKR